MTPLVGEDEPGRRLGSPRFLRRLPIVLRLVIALAAAMSLVLGGAAALVYWRVESALDQQLDADLATYHHTLVRDLRAGRSRRTALTAAPTRSWTPTDTSSRPVPSYAHNTCSPSTRSPPPTTALPSSTKHLTRAPVDLADLVDAAVSPLRAAEGDDRSITVEVTPATVTIDARWLRPAIGNLISNALRHGHGDIHLTATAGEDRLRLTLTDEGPGFPPDFLPRAFDRFTRAEASRTSEGSGLGLAFVVAVATAHGGAAHAENSGCGAAVILDISC
ncbi:MULTISPECIES: sensor histidine kinase [Streptomyces]|uniref:sensor histidine kinase n=1 Tax=Streptomyces TaxID=1883 RepID=UPI0034172D68